MDPPEHQHQRITPNTTLGHIVSAYNGSGASRPVTPTLPTATSLASIPPLATTYVTPLNHVRSQASVPHSAISQTSLHHSVRSHASTPNSVRSHTSIHHSIPLPPTVSGLSTIPSSNELSSTNRFPFSRAPSHLSLRIPPTLNPISVQCSPSAIPSQTPYVSLPSQHVLGRIQSPLPANSPVNIHHSTSHNNSPHIHHAIDPSISQHSHHSHQSQYFNSVISSPVARRNPSVHLPSHAPLFLNDSSSISASLASLSPSIHQNNFGSRSLSVPITPSVHLASPFAFSHHSAPLPISRISALPAVPTISSPILPNTKHIPLLTSKADWGAWHDGVVNLLDHSGC